MAHSNTGRPRSTAAALIAAGVVMAVAATGMPISPPSELTAPRISSETVRLAALPLPMPGTAITTGAADVPTGLADAGGILGGIRDSIAQSIGDAVGKVLAGAGAGVIFGFVTAGVVAQNVIYRIPVVGQALAPLITVIAVAGAFVAAPIGAVLGALSLLPHPPIHLPAAGSKAAPTPHRTTTAGTRSNRQIVSVPSTTKAPAPQPHSNAPRTGTGHARGAVLKAVKRH